MLDLSLDPSNFGIWHAANLSRVRVNRELSPEDQIVDWR